MLIFLININNKLCTTENEVLYKYDGHDLDELLVCFSIITESLCEVGDVNFKIIAFDIQLPVYIFGELDILLEQFGMIAGFLNKETDTICLDFFEQGAEFSIKLTNVNDANVLCDITFEENMKNCNNLSGYFGFEEFKQNVILFYKEYLKLAENVAPSIYTSQVFTIWKNNILNKLG